MDSPEPVDLEGFEFSQHDRSGSNDSQSTSDVQGEGVYGRVSMYVSLFDEMITTVLEAEEYLFTEHEVKVLKYVLELPYPARYLLTRLLLRCPTRIHTFPSLQQAYGSEIGPDLDDAMATLCHVLPFAPPPATVPSRPAKTTGWEAMDSGLTPDEEKSDPELAKAIKMSLYTAQSSQGNAEAGPSRPPLKPALTEDDTYVVRQLCRSQEEMAPEDIMACMNVEELKKVSRLRKVNVSGLGRQQIIQALLASAKTQSLLSFAPVEGTSPRDLAQTGRSHSDPSPKSDRLPSKAGVIVDKSKPKGAQQTQLFFPPRRPSLGPTSDSTPPPRMRPNVVRAKAMTPKLMLMSQLLPYLSHRAISLLPPIVRLVSRLNLVFSRTLASSSLSASALLLPSILVTSNKRRYPTYTPTRSRVWDSRDQLLGYERAVSLERIVEDSLGDSWQTGGSAIISGGGGNRGWKPGMLSRREGAQKVKEIWETVWPEWQILVEEERQKGDADDRRGVLDRFTTGHVLTRIIYKGAAALGILHEYDRECEVLRALLAQRRWRRGKRGAWYDRLALILMNHYNGDVEKKQDAVEVCIEGLMDEETHLIYRPGLSRRLTRLEKQLNLPADERHICDAELKKCLTRTLAAPRAKENAGLARRTKSTDETTFDDETEPQRTAPAQVGRSVWHGREGEVSVEGWVLEWWERKGYKGFHAESSILTTLFGLLMWPVLFHPLKGAFETPYQTAPLDLGEDTFATARRALVEERLAKMEKTSGALEMLRETDDREREKATWAVGIRWDYGREDLEDIVESLGGRALSVICRMLSEEYRHRASGVPDLIVWHSEEKQVRFVEVKGPGDSLSETQKVWIDVLLSAGVDVEVCRVEEASSTALPPSTSARKAMRKRSSDGRSKPSTNNSVAYKGSGKQRDWEDEVDVTDEEDGGGDADEFKYESGEEGKKSGFWQRPNSEMAVINLVSSDGDGEGGEGGSKRRRA